MGARNGNPLTVYARHIHEAVPECGDVRVIEAWMRLKFGTLDHLDPEEFRREAREAAVVADMATSTENDALVRSFGL